MTDTDGQDSTVYHDGERELQRRAGVRDQATEVGGMVRETIPDSESVHDLVGAQRQAIVASVDRDGTVWTSLLTGNPGFIDIPDESHLHVRSEPTPGDPLADHLRPGMPAGVLLMDPRSRERSRLNGRVTAVEEGFVLETQEVFPNCQKYIQQRSLERRADVTNDGRRASDELQPDQQEWVERADTFFIGSYHPDAGADASHRGGDPGFVTATDDTIVYPEYTGNRMFCTLGNIVVNPAVGLLFVDFSDGRTLQVTGQARIVEDGTRVEERAGAERLVEIRVDRVVELPDGNPLRWTLTDRSPFIPST